MPDPTMYDSVTPASIPGGERAALYANGLFAAPAGQVRRFPRHMKIAVFPGQPAQARLARCLDVERFDAGPADIVPFIRARQAAGHRDATIYFSRARWPQVLDALEKGHVSPAGVRLWVADWTGKPHQVTLTAGYQAWAVQYENTASFDLSVIWGADL